MTKLLVIDGDGKGKCEWLVLFCFVLFLASYGVQCFHGNLVFSQPLVVFLCGVVGITLFLWLTPIKEDKLQLG
jgi:hypothetical protein